MLKILLESLPLNITVLGAGAIGSLWAYKLAESGHNTSLWLRHSADHTHRLKLDDQPDISFVANSSFHLSQSDLLLITVKAWQVKEALSTVIDALNKDTIIMFMHNGMGAIDEVFSTINKHPVVVATTTQAAYKPSINHVLHTGFGITHLGGFNSKGQQCSFLAEVFNHSFAEASWSSDIRPALWRKLAINCAINPLTALHQCKNGQLGDPQFLAELKSLINEITQVLLAEGIEIQQDELYSTVMHVVQATAENYSSMQQDIFYQRHSEIDYISGYLCQTAKKHHIDVSNNLSLYNKIKQIEHSWRTE